MNSMPSKHGAVTTQKAAAVGIDGSMLTTMPSKHGAVTTQIPKKG